MSDDRFQLLGDRLVLREFVVTDEGAVHSYACDPVVTQFMEWGPNSIDATRAFLRTAVTQAGTPARRGFDLAVVDIPIADTHRRCGVVGNQRRTPPR